MAKTKLTISDHFGTKTLYFGENFRFQLKILSAFFVIFLLVLFFAIFKLASDRSNLKELNKTLYAENIALKEQNIALEGKNEEVLAKLDGREDDGGGLDSDIQVMLAMNEMKKERKKGSGAHIAASEKTASAILSAVPNGLPMQYRGVTSPFGMRTHPISGIMRMHHGIDLRASEGTPVFATAEGFVQFAGGSGSGYGILVILSHNYGFETRYGHLSSAVVTPGSWVKKGDLIGYSGNTGYSTGPHLHYEVRFLAQSVDPANFMSWNAQNFKNISTLEPNVSWQEIANVVQHQIERFK